MKIEPVRVSALMTPLVSPRVLIVERHAAKIGPSGDRAVLGEDVEKNIAIPNCELSGALYGPRQSYARDVMPRRAEIQNTEPLISGQPTDPEAPQKLIF